jgi:acetyltransferase-like isoleucine patch superfamily enzyme
MSQLRKHLKFGLPQKWRAFRQKLRLGALGKGVWIDKRVELLRYPKNIFIHSDVVLKEGTKICACNAQAQVKIGERTTIGYHNFIFASAGIEIGDDCLIAPFVYIVDSDHGIKRTELINRQPNQTAAVKIGNGVWIASNVTILKGVNIGEGAVIAANSVLNQNVPPYEIWGGSPAKKIGERE